MIKLLAVGAVSFVFALGAVSIYLGIRHDPACNAAVALTGSESIGGPFTLLDSTGSEVTDEDVIDRPSLLYFGYTYCPDVCPIDTLRNADALSMLLDAGIASKSLFITVDPQRDTPQVVGKFAEFFHPSMVGLSGSPEQIKAAADAYRVYFRKAGEGEEYLVDHTTFTYLVLPQTGVVDYFRRGDSPELIAERAACHIDTLG